jgi:hypothetical protein
LSSVHRIAGIFQIVAADSKVKINLCKNEKRDDLKNTLIFNHHNYVVQNPFEGHKNFYVGVHVELPFYV